MHIKYNLFNILESVWEVTCHSNYVQKWYFILHSKTYIQYCITNPHINSDTFITLEDFFTQNNIVQINFSIIEK